MAAKAKKYRRATTGACALHPSLFSAGMAKTDLLLVVEPRLIIRPKTGVNDPMHKTALHPGFVFAVWFAIWPTSHFARRGCFPIMARYESTIRCTLCRKKILVTPQDVAKGPIRCHSKSAARVVQFL
jgi:hypothetical protein